MPIDVEYGEEQAAFADVVAAFCAEKESELSTVPVDGRFPWGLWRGLAGLGVLGLGTVEGGGGALEIAAVMERLGAAGFPGPLPGTFLAGQVLEAPDRARVAEAKVLASVGTPRLLPWAPKAELFLEVEGDEVWLAEPVEAFAPLTTIGMETWGRGKLERRRELAGAKAAVTLSDTAVAAYLAGASRQLVDVAARYAADREQFGRPVGDFQAVAFPLADCDTRVSAAINLARRSAFLFDTKVPNRAAAAVARISATRTSIAALETAHQVLGAMGFTKEGPLGVIRHRIVQTTAAPPDLEHVGGTLLTGLGI